MRTLFQGGTVYLDISYFIPTNLMRIASSAMTDPPKLSKVMFEKEHLGKEGGEKRDDMIK